MGCLRCGIKRRRLPMMLACMAWLVALPVGATPTATDEPRHAQYDQPAADAVALLTAAPPPSPLVHSASGKVALLYQQAVIPLARLARPFEGLAGFRFDPLTYTSGANPLVFRVELLDAWAEEATTPVVWEPDNGDGLAYVRFSPNGRYLSALRIGASGAARLVVYDVRKAREKVLKVPVNGAWGKPCSWVGEQDLVCRVRPAQPGKLPAEAWAPVNIEHSGGPAPTRTYSNLLENEYEDRLFEYYFDSELATVDTAGKMRRIPQTRGLLYRFEPSPDGSLAIIRRLYPPYPRLVPAGRFPSSVEVWNLENGTLLYQSQVSGYGRPAPQGRRQFPRQIVWKPGDTVVAGFIEHSEIDGGPDRYRWMSIRPPFEEGPSLVAEGKRPFASFGWTTAGTPWFSTESSDGKKASAYVVLDGKPKLIWSGEVGDRYGDPGKALGVNGTDGPVMEVDGKIYIAGDGLSPAGPRPFLDRYDLRTHELDTLFTAADGEFEPVLALLDVEGPVLLTARETETLPPNIYRLKGDERTALRPLATPYPQLLEVDRRRIHYRRADGVDLGATLYTPAGWDGETPLPTLVWIYPYEYSDRNHAEQLDVRTFRFHRVKGPSPLAAALAGYAVVVNPTVPIVHEGVGMNDDYVPQLVASTEALADYLVAEGITDNERIAVGGRSYGAFSSANLLVHSDRFATAIAMSGAYNRTLTPFGFQHEKRSFWEATDMYTGISPFFHADEIDEPILLVHGGSDPNPGTPPIQAKRFFHALVGEGVPVRYVELPFEAHHYWARESVLDAANEMIEWLDRTIGCEQFDGTPCQVNNEEDAP